MGEIVTRSEHVQRQAAAEHAREQHGLVRRGQLQGQPFSQIDYSHQSPHVVGQYKGGIEVIDGLDNPVQGLARVSVSRQGHGVLTLCSNCATVHES
jgi:hypothetical protein